MDGQFFEAVGWRLEDSVGNYTLGWIGLGVYRDPLPLLNLALGHFTMFTNSQCKLLLIVVEIKGKTRLLTTAREDNHDIVSYP
jgi:hypothetical protein